MFILIALILHRLNSEIGTRPDADVARIRFPRKINHISWRVLNIEGCLILKQLNRHSNKQNEGSEAEKKYGKY